MQTQNIFLKAVERSESHWLLINNIEGIVSESSIGK